MWYPTRKFCATLQWPAPFCVEKVEVASPSSRIELFGRMWLRTFPRRCGDLWDMYRYVVLPCYGIFMAWPRHAQDSAQIQNLQVLRWSWWMLRFFRARECAPLRRERNCFLDPVLKCAFFPAEAWERNSLLTQQMWSTGTALELPLFLLCIVGVHTQVRRSEGKRSFALRRDWKAFRPKICRISAQNRSAATSMTCRGTKRNT